MLWICDECTTAYSPGAPKCPHCGATGHHDQGDEMPKITKARGATSGGPSDDQPTEENVEAPAEKPAKKAAKKAATKRD